MGIVFKYDDSYRHRWFSFVKNPDSATYSYFFIYAIPQSGYTKYLKRFLLVHSLYGCVKYRLPQRHKGHKAKKILVSFVAL